MTIKNPFNAETARAIVRTNARMRVITSINEAIDNANFIAYVKTYMFDRSEMKDELTALGYDVKNSGEYTRIMWTA